MTPYFRAYADFTSAQFNMCVNMRVQKGRVNETRAGFARRQPWLRFRAKKSMSRCPDPVRGAFAVSLRAAVRVLVAFLYQSSGGGGRAVGDNVRGQRTGTLGDRGPQSVPQGG
jgi:hypothetical protein